MQKGYLLQRRTAKAQASLHFCAVSPQPLLFAHITCVVEILGLIALIFEIKIFAFSFWEAILRSENSIPLKYHVTFVQNLHQPKNLVHCFNWINLSMFLTFPVSSKIWHSWNTECE